MKSGLYFVLYVAVVLEILIIILDRDEAEELLRKDNQEILEYLLKPPTFSSEEIVYRLPVGSTGNRVDIHDRSQVVRMRLTRPDKRDAISPPVIEGFYFKSINNVILPRLSDEEVKSRLQETDRLENRTDDLMHYLAGRALHWQPLQADSSTMELAFPTYVSTLGAYKLQFRVHSTHLAFTGSDSIRIVNQRIRFRDLPQKWQDRNRLESLNSGTGVVYLLVTPPGPITKPGD